MEHSVAILGELEAGATALCLIIRDVKWPAMEYLAPNTPISSNVVHRNSVAEMLMPILRSNEDFA